MYQSEKRAFVTSISELTVSELKEYSDFLLREALNPENFHSIGDINVMKDAVQLRLLELEFDLTYN